MPAPTRFLILSDTHGHWSYAPETPALKFDVLLHCGDLTQIGGLPSFKRAIADIKSIDAELKLVIAGNHDLELDEEWVRKNAEDDVDKELEDSRRYIEFMKAQKEFGIHYLEEGTHSFTLASGKSFIVYASPYTPEFNGYAFADGDEDRFNEGSNPIPAGVDIVMTHGPPLMRENASYRLDVNKDGIHCGCEKLAKAIGRVKPKLHCFGHIHEGSGSANIKWAATENAASRIAAIEDTPLLRIQERGDSVASETLLVNAAIDDEGGKGWLVEMNLNTISKKIAG